MLLSILFRNILNSLHFKAVNVICVIKEIRFLHSSFLMLLVMAIVPAKSLKVSRKTLAQGILVCHHMKNVQTHLNVVVESTHGYLSRQKCEHTEQNNIQ